MPEEGPKGPDGLAWQDTSAQPSSTLIDHYGCISASRAPALHRWVDDCNAAALRRAVLQRQSTEAEHRGRQDGCSPQLSEGGPAKAKAGPQQFIATHVRISTSDELERRRYLINRKQGAPVARR